MFSKLLDCNYRNLCNRLMTEAKSQYFSNSINENSENPRRLWDTINTYLHKTPAAALPESNNVKSLCEHFAKYFSDKIRTFYFRTSIRGRGQEDDQKSASKSCDLDPIPTNIPKALLDIFFKPITTIINISLESGIFPLQRGSCHIFTN